EATTTATGDALLEGVGSAVGTLMVSARGYESLEEALTDPSPVTHSVGLKPLPPAPMVRLPLPTTASGPLARAGGELAAGQPAAPPQVAVTDAQGFVSFPEAAPGSQLIVSADGFVTLRMRVEKDSASEIVFTLSRGYRVIASVELPPTAGPQLVHVVRDGDVSMDDVLDSDAHRRVEPAGRLSLGPLAPGAYVVELRGATGRRTESIRIVDRDVSATFR